MRMMTTASMFAADEIVEAVDEQDSEGPTKSANLGSRHKFWKTEQLVILVADVVIKFCKEYHVLPSTGCINHIYSIANFHTIIF